MAIVIIPFILCTLLSIFVRRCTRIAPSEDRKSQEQARKMPRIIVLLVLLLSAVPILGVLLFLGLLIAVFGCICTDALLLVDNKFTRFWIRN